MKFNVKKVETVATTAVIPVVDDAGGPWMESKKQCL